MAFFDMFRSSTPVLLCTAYTLGSSRGVRFSRVGNVWHLEYYLTTID